MKREVPFVDLTRQYRSIRNEINGEIQKVLEGGQFILGEYVERFEKSFAQYCGAKYGVAVASGTDALELALRALGVGNGDEVITASNTFVSGVDAILYNRATPILADVEPETFNLDVAEVEKRISERTRVILPVHIFGHPAHMRPLREIAEKYGLLVVEDACQAHGAEYEGVKVGALGECGCFSFYPTKNLGAYGDGGLIVTNSEELAEGLRCLRNYGQVSKYEHHLLGYNSRLDEVQAAILLVKLRYLDRWIERRRRVAKLYGELLADLSEVRLPVEKDYAKHVYHLYVIRSRVRDRLREWLSSCGVLTGIHYPIPLHLQPAYRSLGWGEGDFKVTERCAKEILSLPMFPELTDEEITYTAEKIKAFFKNI